MFGTPRLPTRLVIPVASLIVITTGLTVPEQANVGKMAQEAALQRDLVRQASRDVAMRPGVGEIRAVTPQEFVRHPVGDAREADTCVASV